ncbi:MAG: tetratricopeptide repeat protein, partial [Desulfuromonadales bacterium]|nr:tetratricopeptide repeat protein [Desulfuromonadales bacterium]
MNLELSTEQKALLLQFLDDKERDKLLEEWLVDDAGISPFKSKLVIKIVLPIFAKAVGNYTLRGVGKLHDVLLGWEKYSDFSDWAARFLLLKVEKSYSKKTTLNAALQDAETAEFDDQTRVWLQQLEQLNLIALGLDDLKADATLRIHTAYLDIDDQPSRLVRAHNRLIKLVGRERELQRLENFCHKEQPLKWQLITGKGGVGKTRLALDAAEKMEAQGWNAGFLSKPNLETLVAHLGFSRWEPLVDTLMIIDYAASKLDSLKKLFNRAAQWAIEQRDANGDPPRLRILLLERHGDDNEGWLHTLRTAESSDLRDAVERAMLPKEELISVQTRDVMQVLDDTLQAWSKLSGEDKLTLPDFSEAEIASIKSSTGGTPLFLQLAALNVCQSGAVNELLKFDKARLLADAVAQEEEYIQRQCDAHSCNERIIKRATALLCLTGPMQSTDVKLLQLLTEDMARIGFNTAPGEIAEALKKILGVELLSEEETKPISPIYPDLLGEAFVVTQLNRPEDRSFIHESLSGAIECNPSAAWENLLRAVRDLNAVEGFAGIDDWLFPLLEESSVEKLHVIAVLLPRQSVALTRFSIKVFELLLALINDDSEVDSYRAHLLGAIGIKLSKVGRKEEALDATQKAIGLYRCLAKTNPDAFEPFLAMEYNNLVVRRADVGQRQRALKAALIAVKMRKRLAAKNLDLFEASLAASYINLGEIYSVLGHKQQALEAALDSVNIFKSLVLKKPGVFEADLALSYNNLANRYADVMGQEQQALMMSLKAFEIYQKLTTRNPDAFEPDLASSYLNLSNRYAELSRWEQALKMALNAQVIYQRLAASNLAAFEVGLARNCNNLGTIYMQLGQNQQAMEAILKAVEMRESLTANNPDAYEPSLAMSYGCLGRIFVQYEEYTKAKDAFES